MRAPASGFWLADAPSYVRLAQKKQYNVSDVRLGVNLKSHGLRCSLELSLDGRSIRWSWAHLWPDWLSWGGEDCWGFGGFNCPRQLCRGWACSKVFVHPRLGVTLSINFSHIVEVEKQNSKPRNRLITMCKILSRITQISLNLFLVCLQLH